jgi:lipopolysaccharide assembly outer membrane protein LptD (OstA)
MEQAQDIADGAYRYIGNVRFDMKGASMFCDSAYYHSPTKIFEAFSRVHLVQGDTMDLYGDYLHYDENTRMAQLRRNVKLITSNTELKTTELDFDMATSSGFYTRHADIESGENKLKSQK